MMEEYKKRFITEYKELEDRLTKLQRIIERFKDGTLDFTPDTPIEILEMQAHYMKQYLYCLKRRCIYEHIKIEED